MGQNPSKNNEEQPSPGAESWVTEHSAETENTVVHYPTNTYSVLSDGAKPELNKEYQVIDIDQTLQETAQLPSRSIKSEVEDLRRLLTSKRAFLPFLPKEILHDYSSMMEKLKNRLTVSSGVQFPAVQKAVAGYLTNPVCGMQPTSLPEVPTITGEMYNFIETASSPLELSLASEVVVALGNSLLRKSYDSYDASLHSKFLISSDKLFEYHAPAIEGFVYVCFVFESSFLSTVSALIKFKETFCHVLGLESSPVLLVGFSSLKLNAVLLAVSQEVAITLGMKILPKLEDLKDLKLSVCIVWNHFAVDFKQGSLHPLMAGVQAEYAQSLEHFQETQSNLVEKNSLLTEEVQSLKVQSLPEPASFNVYKPYSSDYMDAWKPSSSQDPFTNKVVNLVLSGGDPNVHFAEGCYTLLNTSVQEDNIPMLETLILSGADIDEQDFDDRRPIDYALAGNGRSLTALQMAGVTVDPKKYPSSSSLLVSELVAKNPKSIVLVVGGRVGKTTLLQSLKTSYETKSGSSYSLINTLNTIKSQCTSSLKMFSQSDPNNSQTTGIQYTCWTSESFSECTFLDFASDPIYDASHASALLGLDFSNYSNVLVIVAVSLEHRLIPDFNKALLLLHNKVVRDDIDPLKLIIVGTHRDKFDSSNDDDQAIRATLQAYEKYVCEKWKNSFVLKESTAIVANKPTSSTIAALSSRITEILNRPASSLLLTSAQMYFLNHLKSVLPDSKSVCSLKTLGSYFSSPLTSNLSFLIPFCKQLAGTGHIAFFPCSFAPKYNCIVLRPVVFQAIYTSLFSPKTDSTVVADVNGCVPASKLNDLLNQMETPLDANEVRSFLVSSLFATPIHPSVFNVPRKSMEEEEKEETLFMPFLISACQPLSLFSSFTTAGVKCEVFCWQVAPIQDQTCFPQLLINAVFIHLASKYLPSSFKPSVWRTGLYWESGGGVVNQPNIGFAVFFYTSRINVLAVTKHQESGSQMMICAASRVAEGILSVLRNLVPGISTVAAIIHPLSIPVSSFHVPPETIYPLTDIVSAMTASKTVVTRKDSQLGIHEYTKISGLFCGAKPSMSLLERLNHCMAHRPEQDHENPSSPDVDSYFVFPERSLSIEKEDPLDAVVTMSKLQIHVVDKVAAKWDKIAQLLGFEQHIIDNISSDHFKSVTDACGRMFSFWLSKERDEGYGKKCRTWKTVVDVLKRADYKSEADKLCKSLKSGN